MAKLSMDQIVPLIQEVIDSGAEFKLYPSGHSMEPTIIEHKDSVMLSSPENLKVWDIVLYKRDNGQYVLHRIVKSYKDVFFMCGDSQIFIEKDVSKDCIIAKVSAVYKNEKLWDINGKDYKKAVKQIYFKKPFERFNYRLKNLVKRSLGI